MHSDGLLWGSNCCFVFLRTSKTWWLKRQDSNTACCHLQHNWVSLVLCRTGLHHPQSFTATTNNNFNKVNYDLNSTGLDDKKATFFTTICILHLFYGLVVFHMHTGNKSGLGLYYKRHNEKKKGLDPDWLPHVVWMTQFNLAVPHMTHSMLSTCFSVLTPNLFFLQISPP